MKITALETITATPYENLLWLNIETDEGLIGLGEACKAPAAVEAYLHEWCAPRLIGTDPLEIPARRASLEGYLGWGAAGVETRAISAVDIALWDLFGKSAGKPVADMLGGRARHEIRTYNTCAGSGYMRRAVGQSSQNWALDRSGDYEDLDAFLNRADELAHSLLEEGITGMKIWPFDPPAIANDGRFISTAEMRKALEPFEKIRKRVGDKMQIMVEFHCLWNLPTIKRIASELEAFDPTWYEDPIRMNSVSALKELAGSTSVPICASETLGSRFPYKDMLEAGAIGVVMTDLVWTGGLTEGRKIAALADTYHRPYAPHDCTGPVAYVAAVHSSLSQPNTLIQESVRAFYTGWYKELVTELPKIENGHVLPMQGPGLGTELLPSVFERSDLTTRKSELS